jgi:biopolymer transport protein ExbD
MARHKHYEAPDNEHASLDISSLIDVTFLLLIYFLVTSAVQIREMDLGIQLPVPGSAPERTPIDPLLIQIAASGAVTVGAAPGGQVIDADPADRELPLLSQCLQLYGAAARSASQQPLVQLRVDDGTPQQRVIDVINTLAKTDVRSITFTDL